MARACSAECWAQPICSTCGLQKAPMGRSLSFVEANSMCSPDCSGYFLEPRVGHLFPGEPATD